MKEHKLKKLVNDAILVERKIKEFYEDKILFKQDVDREEIKGHILKAEHNLRFAAENIKLKFLDWALVGCYYACYHAGLALIQTKGYASKNHLATLCVLIKEFYKKELTEEDIELLSDFLDYGDILFYVESKNKRESATYSTKILFEQKEVGGIRIKAAMFVNKIKGILPKNP